MRMIEEYLESLRLVRVALRRAKRRRLLDPSETADLDCQYLGSMERELLWVIEYLETGEVPDEMRSEYKRGTYSRVVPVDPTKLRKMVRGQTTTGKSSGWVTADQDLEALLSILSPREREALVMVRGRGLSFRQAAEYLGVASPGTVANTVRRAERKVRRQALLTGVLHQ